MKDYYSILNIPPTATPEEIKKSYRQLAQALHPDKNQNNPAAATRFHEIKEAYENLTNPAKKAAYLQQRWYHQSTGNKKMQTTITPVSILKQALEVERYVATVDLYRMDKQGLVNYLTELLSDDTIQKLQSYQDPQTNTQIIQTILKTIKHLPPAFNQPIVSQLQQLAGHHQPTQDVIASFTKKINKTHRREKYSILIILLLTVFLCLLILFASR
ncbi:MAG: DnaJ domain-containing protein [Chitinophagaceae bacterium]|nr:J domain-containing protein [Chitinophagaceae bacterium]